MLRGIKQGVVIAGTLFGYKRNTKVDEENPYEGLEAHHVTDTIIQDLGDWYVKLCAAKPNEQHTHSEWAMENLCRYKVELKENQTNRVHVEYLIEKFIELLKLKSFLDGEGELVKRCKLLLNQIFKLDADAAAKTYSGSFELIRLKLWRLKGDFFEPRYEKILAQPEVQDALHEKLDALQKKNARKR